MQETQRIQIRDTIGLWERSLIAWPDGRQDTTTFVAWLQGPNLFADLRQPANPPSFDGVACLADLGAQHLDWMAQQEGFAGRFVKAGDAFEWQRIINLQCPSDAADAGYLDFVDGVLVERGRDIAYIEHWHRTSPTLAPRFAVQLQDQDGRDGFLVRVGEIFMYARGRIEPLPHNGSLPELVATSSLEEARALLDCEISLGRERNGSWMIGRSSLPFRVGADLAPSFSIDDGGLAIADVTGAGQACSKNWKIVDLDVDVQEQKSLGQEDNQEALSFLRSVIGRAS